MPLLTFTKPTEARRWVPWWAAVLFSEHPPRGKQRGTRSAPQRYQYEIRRKPVSQRSGKTTAATQKPHPALRVPQRTRPTNQSFPQTPTLAHRHVHFGDEPPWATAPSASAISNLPKQRHLPEHPQHTTHNAIFGRDTYDGRPRPVHEAPLLTRHATTSHNVKAMHSPSLSFSHDRLEHQAQPLHSHNNTDTRQHCQAHSGSPHNPCDTNWGHQPYPSFHEALQRQLEADLSHQQGPSFHTSEGHMHPTAHTYHVHPDELLPHTELPWHMRAGHRGHIHFTQRAMHHHSPIQSSIQAVARFQGSPLCTNCSSPRKTAYGRDPAAERRLSYERSRVDATSHQQPLHHHPLRCHPVDPAHHSTPTVPWNDELDQSSCSPYRRML